MTVVRQRPLSRRLVWKSIFPTRRGVCRTVQVGVGVSAARKHGGGQKRYESPQVIFHGDNPSGLHCVRRKTYTHSANSARP
jgi:hypothetical protein